MQAPRMWFAASAGITRFPGIAGFAALLLLIGALVPDLPAQVRGRRQRQLAGIICFVDVKGAAQVTAEKRINNVSRREVYKATGLRIETKDSKTQQDTGDVVFVYSNGAAAHLSTGGAMDVLQFEQEPFNPNSDDMSVEPSASRTQVYLDHGTVALSLSQLVAGSSMNYETPDCSVSIRGRKLVIVTDETGTTVYMLEGESTVRLGDQDLSGQLLKAGQQLVIRRDATGRSAQVQVMEIPAAMRPVLDSRVIPAVAARQTVYFQTQPGTPTGPSFFSEAAGAEAAPQEIVTREAVPAYIPAQLTISPSRL